MPGSLVLLKLALLAFWACWFAIVTLTNLFSALKGWGYLDPSWKFASGNYEQVVKAVSKYSAPEWVPRVLFVGVIAWQLVAALLFAMALLASANGVLAMDWINAAFATGILLWAAFMIADEATIKYSFEQPHELLFVAQLACLLVIHIV